MAIYLTFGNIKVTKSTNNVKNLNFKVCVIRKKKSKENQERKKTEDIITKQKIQKKSEMRLNKKTSIFLF